MDTVSQPMDTWNTIPWKKAEREVFKLQKRIYQASLNDNLRIVHKLQRLLMKSWWACLLAVRRVTQDNQGKHTAGIDGVKDLTPAKRLELALKLKHDPFNPKAQPVRRVWIAKRGTTEKRGLGIPTLENRAHQALAKLALEPEWSLVLNRTVTALDRAVQPTMPLKRSGLASETNPNTCWMQI